MLCAAIERLDLHLGRRKCGAKICKVHWVHRRLVVMHVLDDISCQQLPGMSFKTTLDKPVTTILIQTNANFIVSQMAVWEVDFPGGVGNQNIKWRALIWAMSEGLLILSVAISYLPPRAYSGIFKFGIAIMMLDFFLCVIWLPIGVSRTYGFRSAKDVFTSTCMS